MDPFKLKMMISSNNNKSLGRFKSTAPCKKHPKHKQSPGVCSVCLLEKLSQLELSRPKPVAPPHSSSSSSSSYVSYSSSSNGSLCSSPALKHCVEGGVLRYEAFGFRRGKREGGEAKRVGIRNGFWTKLLLRRMNVRWRRS